MITPLSLMYLTPFHWVALIVLGAFALFLIVFAAVAFIGTRFEKISFGQWQDVDPAQIPHQPLPVVNVAIGQGFELLRTGRSGDSSIVKDHNWMLASPDRTMLLVVSKSRLGSAFGLYGRQRDGVWLVTKQASAIASNGKRVIIDEIQTADPVDTITLHRLRVHHSTVGVEPFAEADAPQWSQAGHRAIYEDYVNAGLYVWLDASHTFAKATLLGSFAAAKGMFGIPGKISRSRSRAQELAGIRSTLPPLHLLTAKVVVPLAAPTPQIRNAVAISSTSADRSQSYLPYQADGETRLPVFTDEQQAAAYAALIPSAAGEMRSYLTVTSEWIAVCMTNGYTVVLNPHLATSRRLSRTDLHAAAS